MPALSKAKYGIEQGEQQSGQAVLVIPHNVTIQLILALDFAILVHSTIEDGKMRAWTAVALQLPQWLQRTCPTDANQI
jgi:hypothetical protein